MLILDSKKEMRLHDSVRALRALRDLLCPTGVNASDETMLAHRSDLCALVGLITQNVDDLIR